MATKCFKFILQLNAFTFVRKEYGGKSLHCSLLLYKFTAISKDNNRWSNYVTLAYMRRISQWRFRLPEHF